MFISQTDRQDRLLISIYRLQVKEDDAAPGYLVLGWSSIHPSRIGRWESVVVILAEVDRGVSSAEDEDEAGHDFGDLLCCFEATIVRESLKAIVMLFFNG